LIVDDESGLREVLARVLTSAGYEVTSAATASAGLRSALTEPFDLMLLDLNLPDLTGEQVMQVILDSQPEARILVLSAAPDPRRRVGVLVAGAVDYLAKPFVNAELVARVRLRLRDPGTAPTGEHTRVALGPGAYLDLARHELVAADTRTALSHREFDLVRYLIERRGAVCTRKQLLAGVWGLEFDPGTNVVDVYIRRLRAKLSPLPIETVRNVGYRLAAS
jgi:DNA-binding response OmpR family regulator